MTIFDRMDTDPTVVVMVGVPASGKSTMAAEMLDNDELVYISTDQYVEDRAKEMGTTYDAIWENTIKEATAVMNDRFRQAIKAGKSILWDQTNLGAKKRRSILSQVPKGYIKLAMFFPVTREDQEARLAQRQGKSIPANVIASMWDTMTVPCVSEGFDMVIAV